jgi:hypothetical protein
VSSNYPVVITKFYTGAREVEMDAVASKGQVGTDVQQRCLIIQSNLSLMVTCL